MKILYVTDIFSGIKPLLLEGAENPKGSPAFYYPLKKLIDSNFEVDIVAPIFEKNIKADIKCSLFRNSKIVFFYYNNSFWKRLFYDIKIFLFLRKFIIQNEYDFVYGHGSFGTYGTLASRSAGIPCGSRLYGSFLYYHLQKKYKIFLAFRYYRQYLPFVTKKKFLIITNDGTKGDKLHQILAKKNKYNFHFLLNGTDKSYFSENIKDDTTFNNVLFYAARIEEWKNQEFAIKLLAEISNLKNESFEVHFAGTIYSQTYWERILNMTQNYGLSHRIKYVGVLSREELRKYYKHSFAVLSFYKYSNLGNVAIEALVSGGLLIAKNDGSLDNIVKNYVNGILIETPINAAQKILELTKDPELYDKLKKEAKAVANKVFLNWEERAEIEVELIKKATIEL